MLVRLWLLLVLSCNLTLQTNANMEGCLFGDSLLQIIILVKVSVVKWISTRYNILNLRCTITLTSFEPTFTLNGIPILPSGCQALTPQGGIGRKAKGWLWLPTLALLGVKR